MPREPIDFADVRIGNLVGSHIIHAKAGQILWSLKCDCGSIVTKSSKQLREAPKKKLKMMCDSCKLKTFKRPEKTKLWNYLS